ncbi:hypothetical protein A3850_008905 [Lewinella sp. 4G2]|nr:hypothetical protein A3850_008905 [Lewinella sp. 4G2]
MDVGRWTLKGACGSFFRGKARTGKESKKTGFSHFSTALNSFAQTEKQWGRGQPAGIPAFFLREGKDGKGDKGERTA